MFKKHLLLKREEGEQCDASFLTVLNGLSKSKSHLKEKVTPVFNTSYTLPHLPAWQSFLTMPNFALLNVPGAMLRKWGESASTCPDCWSSSSWSWAKVSRAAVARMQDVSACHSSPITCLPEHRQRQVFPVSHTILQTEVNQVVMRHLGSVQKADFL